MLELTGADLKEPFLKKGKYYPLDSPCQKLFHKEEHQGGITHPVGCLGQDGEKGITNCRHEDIDCSTPEHRVILPVKLSLLVSITDKGDCCQAWGGYSA